MKFLSTPLQGSYIIDLEPFSDDRGWFSRFFCKKEFDQIGHYKEWVQLNHSVTYHKGNIRGMHFQNAPYREIKLVRCIQGSIFDVIIDLRKDSGSFLQYLGVELSAENRRMLYIPEGFAHGFQCLTDNCHLIYHHTEYYTKEAEGGIHYNDPSIGIQWPLEVSGHSDRDGNHPFIEKNFKGI